MNSPVLIAPMVGITDAPLDACPQGTGAGLVSAEMVAAEAVVRLVPRTLELLTFDPTVHPVAALVGSDPQVMAEAAAICAGRGASTVDINLGCPSAPCDQQGRRRRPGARHRRHGTGCWRHGRPGRGARHPKMRLGWDRNSINAPELARALEGAGAAMVTVHGRTRAQNATGTSDWAEIARVKEAVGIPVVGSGDVAGAAEISRRIESGMVDGVIMARAALGNLWFVRQASHLVETGEMLPDLAFTERIELTRRHLGLLMALIHSASEDLRLFAQRQVPAFGRAAVRLDVANGVDAPPSGESFSSIMSLTR